MTARREAASSGLGHTIHRRNLHHSLRKASSVPSAPITIIFRMRASSMFRLSLLLLAASVAPVMGHDIYNGVRGPSGQLCCGGDPVTGDCEGLSDEFIQIQRDGSAMIFSKRYGAWIRIARDTIVWMTIEGDKGVHQGHFCGVPRAKAGRQGEAPTADQPDAAYITYCVFLSPGGV